MNRAWQGEELDVGNFTDACLLCAIDACSRSQWWSDRDFALTCSEELERRLWQARGVPEPGGRHGKFQVAA
jgi:hypothetical protein